MERNRTIADKFMELLRDRMESESGYAIVVKMVGSMSEDDAHELIGECEDLVRYDDYLSKEEAVSITERFVNYDGSQGAHWRDSEDLFRAVNALNISFEVSGEYNRWAFFAVMNMIWSDEWGVLHNYANEDQETRVCAELAVARLEDKDRAFSVRRYLDI